MVRITALFTFVLMLLVCTAFFYLPDLHRYEEGVREEYIREAALRDNIRKIDDLSELTGIELLTYNNRVSEIKEEEVYFSEQFRLAMPEGTDASEVEIENDYRNHSILIHINGAEEDYMYQYPMLGTPEGLTDLTWQDGTVDLLLDSVYEVKRRDAGEYLYLDLVKPHEVYDRVIVVDAGHGGKDVGAVRGDIFEKDLNLAITMELEDLFKEASLQNVGVYFTRMSDEKPTYPDRVALAEETEADLFLSIHCNTASKAGSKASGTTVLYKENADGSYDAKALAELMAEEVAASFETNDRGASEGSRIFIIRESDVPVVLVEVGFMSNPDELKKLTTEPSQRKAAEGILNGVIKAFQEGLLQ